MEHPYETIKIKGKKEFLSINYRIPADISSSAFFIVLTALSKNSKLLIRNVNIKDYSEEQIKAWASDEYDEDEWSKRIKKMNPYVAEIDGQLVGFADVQEDGYIDHFFCHYKYLGQGVGKILMQYIIDKSNKN